jgi:hypothetical protein
MARLARCRSAESFSALASGHFAATAGLSSVLVPVGWHRTGWQGWRLTRRHEGDDQQDDWEADEPAGYEDRPEREPLPAGVISGPGRRQDGQHHDDHDNDDERLEADLDGGGNLDQRRVIAGTMPDNHTRRRPATVLVEDRSLWGR